MLLGSSLQISWSVFDMFGISGSEFGTVNREVSGQSKQLKTMFNSSNLLICQFPPTSASSLLSLDSYAPGRVQANMCVL